MRKTYEFARRNLIRAGYDDILVLHMDGSEGHLPRAPYDKICITAAVPEIPPPLIDQLSALGKLASPVRDPSNAYGGQPLISLEKDEKGRISHRRVTEVIYIPLTGKYGWR